MEQAVSAIIDGFLNGLENKIKSLESEYICLKNEYVELKETISILKATPESAELFSQRNNIRLSGFPESLGESTDQIILNICKQLKVDINEIVRSHRTGKLTASASQSPIIVKSTSYRSRQKFLKARKGLETHDLKRVYILNEDITKQRYFAFYTARLLVKNKKIDSCWIFETKVKGYIVLHAVIN